MNAFLSIHNLQFMSIENNNVVSVNYSLHTIEANGEKVFVEQSNAEEPLTFLFGAGMMIPKFEEELKELAVGDKKSFVNYSSRRIR